MATVDLSSLQETAIKYQKDLKMLPYLSLRQQLGLHGINLYPGVQNKDVLTQFERKGGIMKPYVVGNTPANSDVAKATPMTLQVEDAYASVKDNVRNYKTVSIGPDVLLGKNQTKKHPWELTMLQTIVRTFGEDILDALFPAARNDAGTAPTDCFDGFDTLIDAFVAAGSIAAGNGNQKTTGAIAAPANESDTDAYDILLGFWRAAHPALRKGKSLLLVPTDIGDHYDDAYFNKFRSKPQNDAYGRTTLAGSGGRCQIVCSDVMGTGQRIMLIAANYNGMGLLDFGMDTSSDDQFVQVRYPYEDPNDVQFWIQGSYGTRIRSIHEKVFQINEGVPVANALSGDYTA